jgi:hypothetical protein
MNAITEFTRNTSLKSVFVLGILASIITSCSNDDENPVAVDEEEVITTMNVFLSSTNNGNIVLQSQDLDGDGPNAPEITISGNLAANTTYTGNIQLLNETETPADNITTEVSEEASEHQFFFNTSGSIASTTYSDEDLDGNPVGILFELTTGPVGNGTIQITLRHEPKKPNDGTLADAGGETDIAQIFTVVVE